MRIFPQSARRGIGDSGTDMGDWAHSDTTRPGYRLVGRSLAAATGRPATELGRVAFPVMRESDDWPHLEPAEQSELFVELRGPDSNGRARGGPEKGPMAERLAALRGLKPEGWDRFETLVGRQIQFASFDRIRVGVTASNDRNTILLNLDAAFVTCEGGEPRMWISTLPPSSKVRDVLVAAREPAATFGHPWTTVNKWSDQRAADQVLIWHAPPNSFSASRVLREIVAEGLSLSGPLRTRIAVFPPRTVVRRRRMTGRVSQRSELALGYCEHCNQPLTDERSAAIGYGPECAKKYGIGRSSSIRAKTTTRWIADARLRWQGHVAEAT